MTIEEHKKILDDAIFNRQIARNAFRRLCASKASCGEQFGQEVENNLEAANEAVKVARFNLKRKMQS